MTPTAEPTAQLCNLAAAAKQRLALARGRDRELYRWRYIDLLLHINKRITQEILHTMEKP